MPAIPALQRQRQEDWEFKANLRFTVIPLFQKTKTGIVVHASDPSTRRTGHLENCSEFEASLCYIRSPKPTNKTRHHEKDILLLFYFSSLHADVFNLKVKTSLC